MGGGDVVGEPTDESPVGVCCCTFGLFPSWSVLGDIELAHIMKFTLDKNKEGSRFSGPPQESSSVECYLTNSILRVSPWDPASNREK